MSSARPATVTRKCVHVFLIQSEIHSLSHIFAWLELSALVPNMALQAVHNFILLPSGPLHQNGSHMYPGQQLP